MNRYHHYQNVNSYWYDKVPDHWKKTKNKFVFHQNKKVVGSSWENYVLLTMGKSGVKPRDLEGGGKFPASFENYQVVIPNQIIFCLFDLDETPRTVGKSLDHGMITSAYDVFSTTTGNDPQFWTYFYQMIDDHKGLRPYYTGLRKVVRSETFMGIEVFSPPIEEQKLISRYLDKKTSQIDSLVEKIQRKIDLLKEKRNSLINQYVTKGLDPNVEMKDSGIEWVGRIPSLWKVKPVWSVSRVLSRTNEEDKELLSVFLEKGVVKFSDVGAKRTNVTSESLEKYQLVKPGNLVLNNQQAWRGSVGVSKYEGIVSPAYFILELNEELDSDFANYLFRDQSVVSNFLTSSKGVGTIQRNLYFPHFSRTKICIPSLKEQKEIVDILDSQTQNIDEISVKLSNKINLIKEYRQSLIFSVVTGKVQVTEDMI